MPRAYLRYKPIARSVATGARKSAVHRRTLPYEFGDPDTIDLTKARDRPRSARPADDDTKWRPRYTDAIYVRSLESNGSGSITPGVSVRPRRLRKPPGGWMPTSSQIGEHGYRRD